MFHILVVLIVKAHLVTYTLPAWYPGRYACEEHAVNLGAQWRTKNGAILIGFRCMRVIAA